MTLHCLTSYGFRLPLCFCDSRLCWLLRQVAKLREALQGVADVRADVNAHVDAMEQAQEELDMDAEPTDFARVLDDAAGQAAEDHRCSAFA